MPHSLGFNIAQRFTTGYIFVELLGQSFIESFSKSIFYNFSSMSGFTEKTTAENIDLSHFKRQGNPLTVLNKFL